MNKKDRLRYIKSLGEIPLVFKPVQDALDDIQVIFQDIERCWLENGNTESIIPYLNDRIEGVKNHKIKGFLAYHNQAPIGICWAELPHKRYGNIFMHTIDPKYAPHLSIKLSRSGFLDGTVMELIQFRNPDDYINGFLGMGLSKKFRYRMGLLNEDFPEFSENPHQVTFEPLTVEHAAIIGELSYISHNHRHDLEGYIDYAYQDRCIQHKKKLLEGEFGPIVTPASLLIKYHGKPVGSCMVIDIECWGYKHMAWIFDIALDPAYQGLGLGKLLLLNSLKGARESGYPIIGLAVTYTNAIAYHLYEKIGFQIYEEYYEILHPTALKETDDD